MLCWHKMEKNARQNQQTHTERTCTRQTVHVEKSPISFHLHWTLHTLDLLFVLHQMKNNCFQQTMTQYFCKLWDLIHLRTISSFFFRSSVAEAALLMGGSNASLFVVSCFHTTSMDEKKMLWIDSGLIQSFAHTCYYGDWFALKCRTDLCFYAFGFHFIFLRKKTLGNAIK